MEREILTFTGDEANEIISGGHKDFNTIESEITGTSRWTIFKDIIVQRTSDGKFFESSYSFGATEMQDQSPYEYDEPVFGEVIPKEVVVIKYIWEE